MLNTTQIISEVFNLLFSKNNFIRLLKVKLKEDDCIATLHMCECLSPGSFDSTPGHGNPSSSSKLHPIAKADLNMCMLTITMFHLESLTQEKLINGSSMLSMPLNVVQHSKHWEAHKTLAWVQSNIIQHHNEAEIVNSNLWVMKGAVLLWWDYSAPGSYLT